MSHRLGERPDTIPEERWVVLSGTEGVIFPADHRVPYNFGLMSSWTPSRELVLAAEHRVATFLLNYPRHTPAADESDRLERYSAPLIVSKLATYQRQYSGILSEGHRALFMNFFPRGDCEKWTTEPVEVDDGGHSYFRLIYRPDQGDFSRYDVNGEA